MMLMGMEMAMTLTQMMPAMLKEIVRLVLFFKFFEINIKLYESKQIDSWSSLIFHTTSYHCVKKRVS